MLRASSIRQPENTMPNAINGAVAYSYSFTKYNTPPIYISNGADTTVCLLNPSNANTNTPDANSAKATMFAVLGNKSMLLSSHNAPAIIKNSGSASDDCFIDIPFCRIRQPENDFSDAVSLAR